MLLVVLVKVVMLWMLLVVVVVVVIMMVVGVAVSAAAWGLRWRLFGEWLKTNMFGIHQLSNRIVAQRLCEVVYLFKFGVYFLCEYDKTPL